jgi:TonB-dependent starch-binding outer membrane protein SusC
MRRVLFFLIALLAPAPVLSAQIVSGTLIEAESDTPLPGGVMTLIGPDSVAVAQARTDSVGGFSFTLPRRGSYRLRAEQVGYRAATSPALSIGSLDTLRVEFSLARDAVVLEPLVVKARNRRITVAARRFYERAEAKGFGTFITREDIERRHPVRSTELFNTIPGVHTSPVMGGNSVTIRGNCRPTVYVDGIQVNGYRSIDDLAQPLELEGVEVYRSSHQAPVEFTGLRAGCAVILLWTRIQ